MDKEIESLKAHVSGWEKEAKELRIALERAKAKLRHLRDIPTNNTEPDGADLLSLWYEVQGLSI